MNAEATAISDGRRVKLTKNQALALKRMAEDGQISAYSARVSVATMQALSRRGLAVATGNGHMAFPSSAAWKITVAGRALLTSLQD